MVVTNSPPEPAVSVGLKVLLSRLTSNPAGGVTCTPALKLVPFKIKVVDCEGVP